MSRELLSVLDVVVGARSVRTRRTGDKRCGKV